ncbi:MAG: helix-turn-helix domain-containing protein [Isosphaeraceae bacterium]
MPRTPITHLERELLAFYQEIGVDFAELPPVMTAQQVAPLLGMTVDALSQDRVGGNPIIPYVKLGRRVRYLRRDLIRFLLANRIGETEAPQAFPKGRGGLPVQPSVFQPSSVQKR